MRRERDLALDVARGADDVEAIDAERRELVQPLATVRCGAEDGEALRELRRHVRGLRARLEVLRHLVAARNRLPDRFVGLGYRTAHRAVDRREPREARDAARGQRERAIPV